MAPAGKFRREEDGWFCDSSLPSDIVVVVEEVKFHLHKFPLISRSRKIAAIFEESKSRHETLFDITLEDFPGGADIFLNIVKFCYGSRIVFTPRNVVILYCAADFLEMRDDYGEDNLLSKLEIYFHGHILKHWNDCVLVLQSCESVLARADKLRLTSRCIDAMSVMICTDPSLFGWPMKMYGSLQSPGGSILWNGINTGARIYSDDSNWWFGDVAYLSVELFERLIHSLGAKGVNEKILARAIMFYCAKNLPGLCRWQGEQTGKPKTKGSLSVVPAIDQKFILETIIRLVPEKRGKSFCRFLLGVLRVALIVGIDREYLDSLERQVGMQLEFATLDGILIPSYSDSETLYDCDCVERMIGHFVSNGIDTNSTSPLSNDQGMSSSSQRFNKVSKLVDHFLSEVASDANLMPGKFRRLVETLPDYSRSLHDGIYRAIDIYLKEHRWLSEKEQEQLCTVIDFQKLSIDACEHASQNDRLPIRVNCQALFFEQMHLRIALSGYLNALDSEIAPLAEIAPSEVTRRRMPDNRWLSVSHQNEELKIDMDRMMSRVNELEQEFNRMKEHVKNMKNRNIHVRSPRVSFTGMGCKLLPLDSKKGIIIGCKGCKVVDHQRGIINGTKS